LDFLLDDRPLGRALPEVSESDWLDERVVIPPGTHTLRWEHANENWEGAAIDEVALASSATLTFIGEREISLVQGKPAYARIETNHSAMDFSATGLPAGVTLETGTGILRGTPTSVGAYVVDVHASDAVGSAASMKLLVVVGTQLASALGQPQREWYQGRNMWFATAEGVQTTDDQPNNSDETVAWIETTVMGPDEVSFEWECSLAGALFGRSVTMQLIIDGTGVAGLSADNGQNPPHQGSTGWFAVTRPISAGTHRLRWQFFARQPAHEISINHGSLRNVHFASDNQSYQDWAVRTALPESLAAYSQDPDEDGRINWLEYAFGGNPTKSDNSNGPYLVPTGQQYDFVVPRLPGGAADLLYVIERTETLQSGSWSTAGVEIVHQSAHETTVRMPAAVDASPSYYRVRIENLPSGPAIFGD
jgi:Putative Ig domain